MALENSLYDITQPLRYNQQNPPASERILKLPDSPIKTNIFGRTLNSPLGIPASPLTMSPERIKDLALRGYDLITVKSSRSHFHTGNDFPHWMYVDSPNQLTVANFDDELMGDFNPFANQGVSTANSFGIASEDPKKWIADFEESQQYIAPGQILILSVMPSTLQSETLIEDIQKLALQIEQTTAEIIELNLACPNTGGHGLIYQDLELSTRLLKELQRLLPGRKIVAKIGYYPNQSELEQFIFLNQELAGIASTNTFAMKIVDNHGAPAFGEKRLKAGVSGATIKNLSLQQAGNLVDIRNKYGLKGSMWIIGIGGIVKPTDIEQYMYIAKVDAVQSAVGVWNNPNLAIDYRNLHMQEA
ncbi:MAG: hypothetical protein ABI721_01965 [Candidatus Dojkabacteria bacterium]